MKQLLQTISLLLLLPTLPISQTLKTTEQRWGPFNSSYYDIFTVQAPSTISNGALQVTPDSINNEFDRQNKSGRILYNKPFKLWDGAVNSTSENIVSFNTSFLINIYRVPNTTAGEGFAFIIAPDRSHPSGSYGKYLGLTNASTDGNSTNHFIAIELDTVQEDSDPDANHMGLDINSIRSTKTVSLTDKGIEIAPVDAQNYTVWVQYDGKKKLLKVYMDKQGEPMPSKPLMNETLNIRDYLLQESYFGFSASTGNWTQLNCVLQWNLTIEIFPSEKNDTWLKILLGVGIPVLALLVIGGVWLWCYMKKRRAVEDPKILGALKSLPGTPREFKYKELKKATNNFDEKLKLGQGGFGVVYKGVLANEGWEVAVKKFSRENLKGIDDFLAELTIINRLRHKHLVRLVGWCHQNGILLLVYEYMPNGSLDDHLFSEKQQKTLTWDRRYKIVSDVASALHYLHNEYDQKVVHRDLKASNVLLDTNFNARLGDFGLARALDHEKTSYAELEGIPGTLGYIAPECFHTGKATRESDIFGFGAVVLEVVCGQRPWTKIDDSIFLVDWVWKLYRDGRILEAVDVRLEGDYVKEEAERLLLIGLACSHPIATQRPKTQSIVQITNGSVPAPQVPPFRPAFMWPMMGPGNGTSMTNYTSMTNDNSQDSTPMTSSYYGEGSTPQSAMSNTSTFHW